MNDADLRRYRTLQLAYYEQVKLGPRGDTYAVQEDMLRWGTTAINPVGKMMLWDDAVARRAREIEARRDVRPKLGIDFSCWEAALDELIAELRDAVAAQSATAGTGDGGDAKKGPVRAGAKVSAASPAPSRDLGPTIDRDAGCAPKLGHAPGRDAAVETVAVTSSVAAG